ncbi:MAG: hypothetical protein F4124_12390 [Acidimicrobiia bacterium]|nr:hypothetical protein [Acidimicrobiia bacterium]MXZ76865.1 hypothetical protein [Acidimicrobiia bacterium]MYB74448.1 hypothetical protein [Acidimicrobiia bacterium]MYE72057.1 hypothetical protein [Acidimicrobiia bacterium]MYI00216.1 hypothetical protein [Acidimicrobiia bacterium]
MRVACVLATHLRAKVEMSRHRHLEDSPVLIVDGDPSATRTLVVDHFPAAVGVREGMTLEEAMSHHASAVVLDADEPCYRRAFRRMVADLQHVSDRVEAADLGTAYVRLDGLEGLYGGESGAVSALMSALPAFLSPRVGVADAKFPAFVAARTRRGPGACGVGDDVGTFLAPHSIDLLPVSAAMKGDLHRFGLHTMGAVASVSGHLLSDRFGLEGLRAWSLCNGIDDSPVVPQTCEEPVVEHISMALHPAIEALLMAVDTVLLRAFARPEAKGRLAGSAHLLCEAPGWPAWEHSVRFKQPVGEWESASEIIRDRLEADPPRRPVEDVTLTLSDLTGESVAQLTLLKDARRDRLGRLVEADRRLRPLMRGDHALYRIAGVAPWHPVPEMRFLQMPLDPSAQDTIRPLLTPRPVDVRENSKGEPRSLRAGRRWRKVARIDDRWTFDLWWLPKPVARSYYRVDPGDGRLITLFRDCTDSRWYRQSA